MQELLIVEDNAEYREGANKYFATRKDIQITYAHDYDAAIERLNSEPRPKGMITDCFFPKRTGSNDISLGQSLVEKMALSDINEVRIVAGLKVIGQYVNLEDPEMMSYARSFIGGSSQDDISRSPVVRALKQVSDDGKFREGATHIAKNTLKHAHEDNPSRDYYGALMKAITESEANQPLGLLIAERAAELGLPFVLATSTYHHDILTQPIQNYASIKRWTLVDCSEGCEHQKSTPEFWQRAFMHYENRRR